MDSVQKPEKIELTSSAVHLRYCENAQRIQLTMTEDTAKLLYFLVGGINIDNLLGKTPIGTDTIQEYATEIRTSLGRFYAPLRKHFLKDEFGYDGSQQ